MKKYFLSAICSFLLMGVAFGQTQDMAKEVKTNMTKSDATIELAEGYVKMEITDVSSDDEQMAQYLEMMKGSETEVYFDASQSLTVMNMMGGMVQIKNLLSKEGDMNMYMDMMGQKMHIPATKAEMDRAKAESGGDNAFGDLEFEYDETDRKEILGFDCYKMKSVSDEEGGMKFEAYITESIKTNAAIIQGADLSDFKGFPLEYNITMPQMTMVIQAQDFKTEVDQGVFEIKADGYTKMTFEEFKEQMSGFGM